MPTSWEINHLTCGTAEPCQPYHLPLLLRAHCRYSYAIRLHGNVASAWERPFGVTRGRVYYRKYRMLSVKLSFKAYVFHP